LEDNGLQRWNKVTRVSVENEEMKTRRRKRLRKKRGEILVHRRVDLEKMSKADPPFFDYL